MAELLAPFVGGENLTPRLLEQLQLYLQLLLRWNAQVNLTAVRDPETIVTRHFGESLFTARRLLRPNQVSTTLADVGSGAGFPGIPMKLFAPAIDLTLIESHNKKAVFLREVVRSLAMERTHVFAGRAEEWTETASLVTLRAVEQFERTLPVAASLVGEGDRLGLLVGAGQVQIAQQALGKNWGWGEPAKIPGSDARVLIAAQRLG